MGFEMEKRVDPTADTAVAHVMRDQRRKLKRVKDCAGWPMVYVVSRYAGDVKKNRADAIRYCRYVLGRKYMPVASHLLYPQFLSDNDPADRMMGSAFGLRLLALADEVWVFGKKPYSEGMEREIEEAQRLKKRVRYFEEERRKK